MKKKEIEEAKGHGTLAIDSIFYVLIFMKKYIH